MDFIFDEIIPFIKNNVKLINNPKEHIIAGFSLGALISAYVGLHKHHHIQNILCQSPAFMANDAHIISSYQKVNHLALKFYFAHGYYEKTYPEFMECLNQMFAILKNNHIDFNEIEYSGAHIYTDWQDTLSDGIKYLLK